MIDIDKMIDINITNKYKYIILTMIVIVFFVGLFFSFVYHINYTTVFNLFKGLHTKYLRICCSCSIAWNLSYVYFKTRTGIICEYCVYMGIDTRETGRETIKNIFFCK